MEKIVVLSGAGISKESGLKTFRDDDGLWKSHRVEELATPHAWQQNQELVLEFYNWRRKQLLDVEPNPAHYALVELEKEFDVQIVTQNVDDLHERAGSSNVLHLHGEIRKARSTADENLVYDIDGWELKTGDTCEKGSQLRPHVVWFGEPVTNIEAAARISQTADIFLIIGTSLAVYPAAGLVNYVSHEAPKYLIDPTAKPAGYMHKLEIIKEQAGKAVPLLVKKLLGDEN